MPLAISSARAATSLEQESIVQKVSRGTVATLALALAAHIAFPLPFTPVPFTLQPLAVLAVGLLLGPLDGTLALLAYLAEGALGLPVFSPTGPGGLLQLLGPTGGYLLADPVVALIAGLGVRQLRPFVGPFGAACISSLLAVLVLFISGSAWLAALHPLPLRTLWMVAVGPFLPGECVKIFVAAGLYRTLHLRLAR